MRKLLPTALALAALLVAAVIWQARPAPAAPQAALTPLPAPTEAPSAYARATEPGGMAFPRDLGPHPAYQTEWWYYTGNLATAAGRPFGFQLTFFRRALTPPTAGAPDCPAGECSDWRSNQLYLAHFALSDVAGDAFYAHERFSRAAAGLAGAQADPYRVWLEHWSAAASVPDQVRLQAAVEGVGLDLSLTQTLPPILHGQAGLSPKGPEPGNASYYYSIVQQQVEGSLTAGGEQHAVTGRAWKDHEYGTSALGPGAVGWDWFSLQFEDGSALMFFQIRSQDGRLEPASSGTFVLPDGATRHLTLENWSVEVLDDWASPVSGAIYPAGWRIQLSAGAELALEIEGRPLLANQELNLSTVYWEGAVEFDGQLNGRPAHAVGYIELTGYAEPMTGRL
ncbi:MAG: lipocalin-like domain-containing protein [Candidatus Promineifilaceae bacterium]